MAQMEITKEEIDAVYPTVAATVADALGCETDEAGPLRAAGLPRASIARAARSVSWFAGGGAQT